jgi:hypothetical protein
MKNYEKWVEINKPTSAPPNPPPAPPPKACKYGFVHHDLCGCREYYRHEAETFKKLLDEKEKEIKNLKEKIGFVIEWCDKKFGTESLEDLYQILKEAISKHSAKNSK